MAKQASQSTGITNKKIIGITVVFCTFIALVTTFISQGYISFFQGFMMSQINGISICTCIFATLHYSAAKSDNGRLIGVFAGFLAGVLLGSFFNWVFMYITVDMPLNDYIYDILIYSFPFCLAFGIPIIWFFISWGIIEESESIIQEGKIKRLTMEKESAMTTLRLLQAQIEPHFLFNTLSNIITLLDIDTPKAKAILIDLNEYLRISLKRTRDEMITLEQELELVKRYLDIFKVRMGKRLTYKIKNETGIDKLPFPPMIIQPLVENSIKYGLEPKMDGGFISIKCSLVGGILKIIVSDTGKGFGKDINKAGIGIENVSRRLENI